MAKKISRNTFLTDNSPSIKAFASIAGSKESEGPIGTCFDKIETDSYFGQDTWEKAESELQKQTVGLAISKAGLKDADIDYILSGDLINQCIGTTYGLRSLNIPFLGITEHALQWRKDCFSVRSLQTAVSEEILPPLPHPTSLLRKDNSAFPSRTEVRELPPRNGPVRRPEPLYFPRREEPLISEELQ